MCRYAFKNYLTSYVCCDCRHVAQYHEWAEPRCPHCGHGLILAGRDFAAPRKRDRAGWQAVKANLEAGRSYDSCGCNGPGYRARTPAQLRQDVMARPFVSRAAARRRTRQART